MTKVLLTNTKTAATTSVNTNRRGDVSAANWKAALRRIEAATPCDVNPECYPEFIYSAFSGKLLIVRFAGAAS